MLPDRLVAFVRARMAAEAAQSEGHASFVAEAGGMTLGGTIGCSAHLRPDGSTWICEVTDWVKSADEYQWRPAERQEGFGWLRIAGERFPELTELMPKRAAGDGACPTCNGSGHLTRGSQQLAGLWCEACEGLGWIVP